MLVQTGDRNAKLLHIRDICKSLHTVLLLNSFIANLYQLQLKGSGPVHAEKHQMLFEHDIEATASPGSVKAKAAVAKVTLAPTSGNISHGSQIASGNASNSGTHQQNRSESSRRDGDRRIDRRSRSRSPRHRGTVSYDRRSR